ncbi:MAG: polymer-forming cytoskeletal protein [Thermoanaerobaculia bacterium]
MAWKRNEPESPARSAPAPAVRPSRRPGESATIGASIRIKGDLSGDEDLLIQGRIQGQVNLLSHNVTVGPSGRVKADIRGRTIRIEGEVNGNLYGEEEIVIRASGRVQGNLQAPRVTLENGSTFKGSIDMDSGGQRQPAASAPAPKTAPGPAVGAKLATDTSKG